MDYRLAFDIQRQPDDTTCGATCLHAVYRFFDDPLELTQVISEIASLADGGTLGVILANHALARGYSARVYSYNLQIFDPTWFGLGKPQLTEKLVQQLAVKKDERLRVATEAYLEFIDRGGELRDEELSAPLVRKILRRGSPVLTGLSSTYLYHEAREIPETNKTDDVRGHPVGHFVVLCGIDNESREVMVADPMHPNRRSHSALYSVPMTRLIASILLGILTYDANLLVIKPQGKGQ